MEEGYAGAANAGGEYIAPLAQRYTLRVRYSPLVSDMRLVRAICARTWVCGLSQVTKIQTNIFSLSSASAHAKYTYRFHEPRTETDD